MINLDRKEEIKKAAMATLTGDLFSDKHLDSPEDVYAVFMPLAFMDKEQFEEFTNGKEPVFVYEYLTSRVFGSYSGFPVFTSCRFFDQEEYDLYLEYFKRYTEAFEMVL